MWPDDILAFLYLDLYLWVSLVVRCAVRRVMGRSHGQQYVDSTRSCLGKSHEVSWSLTGQENSHEVHVMINGFQLIVAALVRVQRQGSAPDLWAKGAIVGWEGIVGDGLGHAAAWGCIVVQGTHLNQTIVFDGMTDYSAVHRKMQGLPDAWFPCLLSNCFITSLRSQAVWLDSNTISLAPTCTLAFVVFDRWH